MKTAILVDGGFYRRRAKSVWGDLKAAEAAEQLVNYCNYHMKFTAEGRELYRVLYYDCPPMERKVYHPYLANEIDFSSTSLFTWMTEFLNELKKKKEVCFKTWKISGFAGTLFSKRKDLEKIM